MESLEAALNATLADLVDTDTFREVCASYYNLFDVPLRVFDNEDNLISETAHNPPACQHLNKFEAGRKNCVETRLKVKRQAVVKDQSRYLDCICALRYTMVPVTFQGDLLGKVVFGPYLPAEIERMSREALEIDPRIDGEKLKSQIGAMRRVSETAIQRIAEAFLSVTDVILFSAHKALVTSQMHISSIRESYQALTDKNRELEDMNEQMQAFERLKANFLSTVSHELRTPLTSIIGYSDMLAEGIAGDLGEEQRQFVETIKTKGDELLGLITSILDFSKIETGHLDLLFEEVSPLPLIQKAASENQELAKRRGIKLIVDVPDDLAAVNIDPEKILVALNHMIENAVKFSPPDSMVKISAGMTSSEDDDMEDEGIGFVLMSSPDWFEIIVEDFGIGISEGDQKQIFAPFSQLDNSSTREHGGSGLGLAIVKHYVDAHGGRVNITSRVGEGSKFVIRIPVIEA
jgi:signal transduction histidine kinase